MTNPGSSHCSAEQPFCPLSGTGSSIRGAHSSLMQKVNIVFNDKLTFQLNTNWAMLLIQKHKFSRDRTRICGNCITRPCFLLFIKNLHVLPDVTSCWFRLFGPAFCFKITKNLQISVSVPQSSVWCSVRCENPTPQGRHLSYKEAFYSHLCSWPSLQIHSRKGRISAALQLAH